MENNKYDIGDLIKFSVDQKPLEFEQAYTDIVLDRIHSAVEAKKIEIATTMFNDQLPDNQEEE